MAQATAADLFSRHTMVFSNVPGPNSRVFWGTEEIRGFHMVYPNITTQVGIISLNNCIWMNFTLDPVEIQNAAKLGQFVYEELQEMAKVWNVDWIEPKFEY
eukprot:UN03275